MTIDGNHASRIFAITGTTANVHLTDLTMTGGQAPNGGSGGAVLLGAGSLSLDGVAITDSAVGEFGPQGGGLFAADGTRVDVRGSEFFGNDGGYGDGSAGGAIAAGTGVALAIHGSSFEQNHASGEFGAGGGAIYLGSGGSLVMEDTLLQDNSGSFGGGLRLISGTAEIARSSFVENSALIGGAISAFASDISLNNTTVASNSAYYNLGWLKGGLGGGINVSEGSLVVRNSTITGNYAEDGYSPSNGGGIAARGSISVDIANSIVVANTATTGSDIFGSVTVSNGHNIFGSDVLGNVAGDVENAAAREIFASVDPGTGGGRVNSDGVAGLRNSADNLALGAASSFDALGGDQLGHVRAAPSSGQPDAGSAELGETLSTHASANNDVLTGTSGTNTISGGLGNDRIIGLGPRWWWKFETGGGAPERPPRVWRRRAAVSRRRWSSGWSARVELRGFTRNRPEAR